MPFGLCNVGAAFQRLMHNPLGWQFERNMEAYVDDIVVKSPEADQAFQDLKKYLTSPPVMVAPRPFEPLVLYLAATPYSASAALVAVREEHQAKGALCQAAAEVVQGQEGAAKASATEGQAQ